MRVTPFTAAGLLLLASCASGRIKRENAIALANADARVLDGCYDCLLDARRTYERLANAKHVARDTIALRLFETTVLLAIRERELALDASARLDSARAMASRLTMRSDAERIVRIAEAVLPDATGRTPGWTDRWRYRTASFVPMIPDEIRWLKSDSAPFRRVTRDYVALAIDCSYDGRVLAPRAQTGATSRRPVLLPDSPPIIIYRTGICMKADTNMLAAVRALVLAFHEAAYFAAKPAVSLADKDGGTRADTLLKEAYARFPTVMGVTFLRGSLAETVGECAVAVQWYDSTLRLDAQHNLALLGRTECFSKMHQDTAAAESATRLLALDGSTTGPAYYWRALSWYRMKTYTDARADADSAKRYMPDGAVFTIAGAIENEQNDLDIAERDLRSALAQIRGEENCMAAWILGLVLRKKQLHGQSAEQFEGTMTCHENKIAAIAATLDDVRAHPPSNAKYLAKKVAALEADAADNRTRYFASAYNAAGSIANAGKLDRALELLDIAARDSTLIAPVGELRAAITAARIGRSGGSR